MREADVVGCSPVLAKGGPAELLGPGASGSRGETGPLPKGPGSASAEPSHEGLFGHGPLPWWSVASHHQQACTKLQLALVQLPLFQAKQRGLPVAGEVSFAPGGA